MMALHSAAPLDIEDEATEIDTDCRVCLGPCHGPTHQATLRVHRWFRDNLNRKLAAIEAPKIDKLKPRKFETPTNKREDVTVELVARMKAERMTMEQIAVSLKCSMNAVRDRLQRANGERDRMRRNGAA